MAGSTLVMHAKDVKPGDHVAWQVQTKPAIVEHHAIVHNVNTRENTLQVIHYVVHDDGSGEVVQQWVPVNYGTGAEMRRIEYSANANPTKVIKQALSRLGEKKYSLIENNCEHFAIWCKTGESKSLQVEYWIQQGVQALAGAALASFASLQSSPSAPGAFSSSYKSSTSW